MSIGREFVTVPQHHAMQAMAPHATELNAQDFRGVSPRASIQTWTGNRIAPIKPSFIPRIRDFVLGRPSEHFLPSLSRSGAGPARSDARPRTSGSTGSSLVEDFAEDRWDDVVTFHRSSSASQPGRAVKQEAQDASKNELTLHIRGDVTVHLPLSEDDPSGHEQAKLLDRTGVLAANRGHASSQELSSQVLASRRDSHSIQESAVWSEATPPTPSPRERSVTVSSTIENASLVIHPPQEDVLADLWRSSSNPRDSGQLPKLCGYERPKPAPPSRVERLFAWLFKAWGMAFFARGGQGATSAAPTSAITSPISGTGVQSGVGLFTDFFAWWEIVASAGAARAARKELKTKKQQHAHLESAARDYHDKKKVQTLGPKDRRELAAQALEHAELHRRLPWLRSHSIIQTRTAVSDGLAQALAVVGRTVKNVFSYISTPAMAAGTKVLTIINPALAMIYFAANVRVGLRERKQAIDDKKAINAAVARTSHLVFDGQMSVAKLSLEASRKRSMESEKDPTSQAELQSHKWGKRSQLYFPELETGSPEHEDHVQHMQNIQKIYATVDGIRLKGLETQQEKVNKAHRDATWKWGVSGIVFGLAGASLVAAATLATWGLFPTVVLSFVAGAYVFRGGVRIAQKRYASYKESKADEAAKAHFFNAVRLNVNNGLHRRLRDQLASLELNLTGQPEDKSARNKYTAAAVIVEHLKGRDDIPVLETLKRQAQSERASKGIPQSVSTSLVPLTSLTPEQWEARAKRKAAVDWLAQTGMTNDEVRALKDLLTPAAGQQLNEDIQNRVFKRIVNHLSGELDSRSQD